MPDPVPVAADDPPSARRLLAEHPSPAAGWEIIPTGVSTRRRARRGHAEARVPAVTVRDTRGSGTTAEVRQCMLCGSPVTRIEDRGPRGGGSRLLPCGHGETDLPEGGGVLSAEFMVREDRLGQLVDWLTVWADDPDGVGPGDDRRWLVRLDPAAAGSLMFSTP